MSYEAEPIRWRASALRRRDLTDPALERPRMAFPEARDRHRINLKWRLGRVRRGVRPMSALGQKQTWPFETAMSALPPKADIRQHGLDVRFLPKAEVAAIRSVDDTSARSPCDARRI